MTDEEAIRVLVDAAPPFPADAEQRMAKILGPAYVELLEREAARAAGDETKAPTKTSRKDAA